MKFLLSVEIDYKYELSVHCWDSTVFDSSSDNIAMSQRNLFNLLLLSLLISFAIAEVVNEETKNKSEVKDEKTVSKRGALHFSHHGHHAHPAIVSASHYHLPPAFVKYPVNIHKPLLPLPVGPQFIPAPPVVPPHYHIVPGGASVTSYSVNYPRWPRPAVPRPYVPIATPAAVFPAYHHHHHQQPSFHQYSPYVPHYHAPTFIAPKPVIPVAIPFPGIRFSKLPVFFNQPRPVFTQSPSQFIPVAHPHPTFLPIPVPSNPQPPHSGFGHGTHLVPVTQDYPQIPSPTQPTFVHQHGWQPMTQPTFTNKHPPYNYHAPAVPFNHEESTNDVISGQGQVSSQLIHQLALYRNQQQQQELIHQQESRLRRFGLVDTF